jgi:hypothetical protein
MASAVLMDIHNSFFGKNLFDNWEQVFEINHCIFCYSVASYTCIVAPQSHIHSNILANHHLLLCHQANTYTETGNDNLVLKLPAIRRLGLYLLLWGAFSLACSLSLSPY